MRNQLIDLFLKINTLFPNKYHPFDDLKDGITNMNYTDFEYNHCQKLLEQYTWCMNLEELRGKKILEIGCGGGGKIIYISENFQSQVTGIDLNLHFLSEAKKKSIEKGVQETVEFFEMDALNMSFSDETFDFILMSDVLEHIPNTQKLLLESLRVLKKNGTILFDFAPYYHYFGHHLWDTIKIPWLHLFTTEQFRIDIYKRSLQNFPDAQKRLELRIGVDSHGKESFTYLNKITRKQFENIISNCEQMGKFKNCTIRYFMLKNMNVFSFIPLLRECFIRHIVGVIKK